MLTRFATLHREVSAARLLGLNGVMLGRLGPDYLRHDGPEHVLCFAPTRSGMRSDGGVDWSLGRGEDLGFDKGIAGS